MFPQISVDYIVSMKMSHHNPTTADFRINPSLNFRSGFPHFVNPRFQIQEETD